jgi:uncharacterized repeat protein (TIGR03803 family)
MTNTQGNRGWAAVMVAAILMMLAAAIGAPAQMLSVLYTFTGGADGGVPVQGVVPDGTGNFYGTAAFGGNALGTSGAGVVFKLDSTGTETVLYTFTGGVDGRDPEGVVRDGTGNLYGITAEGGTAGSCAPSSGCGVVFKLDPTGNETVLHSFTGGSDGASPNAPPVRDAVGNLYGTTILGGTFGGTCASYGCGVVYMLDPADNETVLHSFTGGSDGAYPYDGVIRDSAGNLYGTTMSGGIAESCGGYSGCGVVFRLDSSGNESVLHTFYGGANGTFPFSGVVRDAAGNLYGSTEDGGTASCTACGLVFKLSSAAGEAVLHRFSGPDGDLPFVSFLDQQGNLYGTTEEGGAFGYGTVFRVSPLGKETILYSFTGGSDGAAPYPGLVPYKGSLYGTTGGGGSGWGVVFKLSIPVR